MVLLGHFGQAQSISGLAVRYQKQGDAPYLEVKHTRRGGISNMVASANFPMTELTEIIHAIDEALVDGQRSAFGQSAAFSSKGPVDGYFRYRDKFQMLPTPPSAPKTPFLAGKHPFLLQYSYVSSSHPLVDARRRQRLGTIYLRLLNLFIYGSISLPSLSPLFTWVIENTESPEKVVSAYRQQGYLYPGFNGKAQGFSELNGIPPLCCVLEPEYDYQASRSNALLVSSTLTESLDRAFSLCRKDFDAFYMAVSWFSQADALWHVSRSASYIALVTAMERLMPKAEKCPACQQTLTDRIETCSACGQPQYSIGKTFRRFLDHYVPGIEGMASERKVLYAVRSHLAHGLNLFGSDLEPWNFLFDTKAREEDQLHRNLAGIVRTALCNWLREKSAVSIARR